MYFFCFYFGVRGGQNANKNKNRKKIFKTNSIGRRMNWYGNKSFTLTHMELK